jgi:hypothetical protein
MILLRKVLRWLWSQECLHTKINDDPPTCARCGAFVCVRCRATLRYPVGLCFDCAEWYGRKELT